MVIIFGWWPQRHHPRVVQVSSQSRTLNSLWTHHLPKTFWKVLGFIWGQDSVCRLHIGQRAISPIFAPTSKFCLVCLQIFWHIFFGPKIFLGLQFFWQNYFWQIFLIQTKFLDFFTRKFFGQIFFLNTKKFLGPKVITPLFFKGILSSGLVLTYIM